MWLLIASFILISSAGLAGVSKIVKYSNSFHFAAAAATAAAGGIAISNGVGRVACGSAVRIYRTRNRDDLELHPDRRVFGADHRRRSDPQRDPVCRHGDPGDLLLGSAVLAVPGQ